VYGHAVAGQAVSAMIIQKRGNEVHLDIRPVISGKLADDETAGFGNVGAARALFPNR
jgi:hypothetical protein